MSHPKDTGKEGLTELPKFRTQSRPQWESNPAGKNVRSPFILGGRNPLLSKSATFPLAYAITATVSSLHNDVGGAGNTMVCDIDRLLLGCFNCLFKQEDPITAGCIVSQIHIQFVLTRSSII